MFLIVFVTLMISIISLYAQVLTLQTAQLYRAQNGLMQTMINWHGSAVAKVLNYKSSMAWTAIGLTGCSMTTPVATPALAVPSACGSTTSPPAPLSSGDNYLVTGYKTTNYSFYSVAYQDTTTTNKYEYVITFAYPKDSTTREVYLPDANGVDSGYTINDLNAQFMRAAPSNVVFGSVSNGTLVVPSVAGSLGPSGLPTWIPGGAIAVVTLVR